MSEFTNVTIVKNKTPNELLQYIKNNRTDGYTFPVNKYWSATVFENQLDIGFQVSKQLSKDLETYVFFFLNCEDSGWSYFLYYKGEQKDSIQISFDNDTDTNIYEANFPLLIEIGGLKDELDKLQNYLSNYSNMGSEFLEGVEFFKKAFGFEKIEWTSYEYFSSLAEYELDNLGILSALKKSKPIRTKSVIMKVMKKKLSEMGYIYDKAYDRGGYTFVQEKNGFLVGLSIVIWEGTVEYRLKTPIMISNDETIFYNYGIFNTQLELENILETFLNKFIEKGDKFIKESPIEKFDVFQTCSNSIDTLFEEYGFKRIGIENNYFGLVIIYGKSDMKVCIQHNKMEATLSFKIINKKGEELFLHIIMDNYYLPGWRYLFPIYYKNQAEYIELIKKHLDFLVEANFPQSYDVRKR